ncbi:uncharacterized protein LOC144925438 [Branchiostoma floridae x Branchiostoma belcheri]
MRPFLLAAFVIVFVGSFADAFWGSSSSGKKGSDCNSGWPWLRRKCDDDNVEDDQPEKIEQTRRQETIKSGNDGKKCKKSWFGGKCRDDNVKEKQSKQISYLPRRRETFKSGNGEKKCKPSFWFGTKCADGQDNSRGNKKDDQDGIKGNRKPNPKGWPLFSGSMNKRNGEDGKKCKRSWLGKCLDKSDGNADVNRPAKIDQDGIKGYRKPNPFRGSMNKRKGEDGKKCKRSWLGKCLDKSDGKADVNRPAKIDHDGIEDSKKANPRGWMRGSMNKRKGEDGKKCKRRYSWLSRKCLDNGRGNKKE